MAPAAHDLRGRAVAVHPRPLTSVLIMGLGFFFTKGGFIPVQMFASSLLNLKGEGCHDLDVGDISIGLIYLVATVAALLAPTVVQRVGAANTMILSSIVFPLFVGSVTYIVVPVVFATSIMLGFAGTWLNIAQGAALADCTTLDNHGRYSGIFMAFNQGASLPGNIVAHFLIKRSNNTAKPCNNTAELLVPGWNSSDSPMFLVCACFCVFGTLVLTLYRAPPPVPGALAAPVPPTPLESLKCVAAVCCDRDGIRLLVPYMLYTGVSVVFYSGMLTRQLESKWVGLAMCIFGGAQIVGGPIVGVVIDRLGVRSACVYIVVLVCSGMAVAHFANLENNEDYFYIASGVLGLVENAVQTTAYAVLTTRFSSGDATAGGDGDTVVARGHVQQGEENGAANEAAAPLLGRASQRRRGAGYKSSDGFSALFLIQGLTIGVMFFLLPLSANKNHDGTIKSSRKQFFCEQAVILGLLVVGVAFLFADAGATRHS